MAGSEFSRVRAGSKTSAFGLGRGCSPTALPWAFCKALYLPVSVRELGVAGVPASLLQGGSGASLLLVGLVM